MTAEARRSKVRQLLTGLLLVALLVPATTGCAQGDPFTSTELNGKTMSLDMPTIGGGQPFITADVRVAGGPEVRVLVDTGSPGLRILADQVGSTGLIRSTDPSSATYQDGTTLAGIEAQAPVSIEGFQTSGPIKIALIDDVSCAAGQPQCVGARGAAAFARSQGFQGIMGIGLMGAPVFSPLMQLAGGPPSTFTIVANPASASATLTFNVTPTQPLGVFAMPVWTDARLGNGVPAWASNQSGGCWSYNGEAPQCLPTAFDTGSPRAITTTAVPGSPPEGDAPAGSELTLSAPNNGPVVWQLTAGSVPGVDQLEIAPRTAGVAANSGVAIFTTLAVTFDVSRGQVLVAARN